VLRQLVAALTLLSPTAALAQDANANAANFVTNELRNAVSSMPEEWTLRQGFIGHLDQGSTFDHRIRIDRATTLQFKAWCDADCSDVDIQVLNGAGAVVASDMGTSDQPVVSVAASRVGSSGTVRVRMYNCTTAPCYYSIAMFSR
jgi:hypothetical protein